MKFRYLVFSIMLATSAANAADEEHSPTFIGGGQTCEIFIHSEMQADAEHKLALEAYIAGYASASISMMNFNEWNVLKLGGNVGKGLLSQKKDANIFIVDWMRNYCIHHPDVVIASAVNDLYYDMQKRGY
ncbi:hypothetical protein [Gluconobacter cerinus]|uniref:Uncharacterized protein n=1 Tax=Gluconobacter cerinus TaxID=38307 RepID=A0A1B6VKN4_9PROT|nr:hypothetical protein [Gluconobacter cerinus]OAJ67766.1 hypothetical protein A0123_01808 [Gluconobacter cerinus]